MSFLNSIFSDLKMSMTAAGFDAAQTALHFRKRDDGRLQFVSSIAYDNIFARASVRISAQLAFSKISQLYPQHLYRKAVEDMRKATAPQQNEINKIIINGHAANEDVHNPHGISLKYRGEQANEGLLLWIGGKTMNTFQFHTYWDQRVQGIGAGAAEGGTVVQVPGTCAFMDLGADVSAHSAKNLILTNVQGRDYTRKEMISNGDFTFTVKGAIVSNFPDIYPYEEVSKFLTLMQHKGVLQVYNLMFQQYNVTQILIKDFSTTQKTGFKNVQPYSFTCVAVEPDKDIEIVKDTIGAIDMQLRERKKKGWSERMLDKVKSTAADQSILLLEDLTKNI